MDCSITITPIFAVEKHGTNYKYVKILIADYPNTIFVVRNFVESYNSTPTKKPFMPYPGVSGFFDAEGRGLEQDGAPQCAKNAEIRHFLVRGKVPSLRPKNRPCRIPA